MTVYQMRSLIDGAGHDTRYFREREKAINEAQHLAEIFAAMYRVTMERHDVDKFGIVAVWCEPHPVGDQAQYEIRLEEGRVED